MGNSELKTVLLVEDEIAIASAESKIIEQFGYNVFTADSGENAVAFVKENGKIDLVLMNINLDGRIDGPEAARQILENRNIPIVFLTAHSEKEYGYRMKEVTCYGYVAKNSGSFVLKSTIEMAFELFEANRKLAIEVQERRRAENELRKSDERLHFALKKSMTGIWDLDLVNHTAVRSFEHDSIFGYNELLPEWTYEMFLEHVLPEERDAVNRKFQSAVKNHAQWDFKCRIRRIDDEIRWIHATGYHVSDDAGNISRMIGIVRDITECKKFVDNLQNSEETFRALFEKANEGIFIMSPDTNIIRMNEAFAKMHGYELDEMQNFKLQDLDIEDQSKIAPERIQRAMNGENLKFEVKHRHKNGSIIDVEVSTSWFPFKNGIYLVGFHRDITGSKRMEEMLLLTDSRYRSIIENQSELICRYTPDGRLTFVNRAYSEYYKKTPAELIDKNFMPVIPEPDLSMILGKLAGITKDNPSVAYTHRIATGPSNEIRWQSWTQHGIFSGDGTLLEYQAVGSDITDRKLSEEKIENLLEENKFILREVHHRIKNNMNSIGGILTLQAAELNDQAAIDALLDARSRIISTMILYEKLYCMDNFSELSFKKYITSLIHEVIRIFPTSGIKNTEISIDDFIIDSKRLSHLGIIINEIITNAMKYAFTGRNDGTIKITATNINKLVKIVIEDNGRGIPDPDFSSPNKFGLQLVAMMTKMLHGALKVENNAGTIFTLEFNL